MLLVEFDSFLISDVTLLEYFICTWKEICNCLGSYFIISLTVFTYYQKEKNSYSVILVIRLSLFCKSVPGL